MRLGLVVLGFAALVLFACQSGTAVGTTCARTAECTSPLVCRLGRCREECRLNRDCPIATRCLIDADGLGSCSLSSDVCGAGTCEGGLICIEGACVSGCDPSASSCPADARCVPIAGTSSGICDDSRVDSDAGTADGGTTCSGSACGHATAIAIAGMGDGFEALACVVRGDGEVWCWGADPHGDGVVNALCPSNEPCSPVPARVRADGVPSGTPADLPRMTGLAGGEQAMCAIGAMGGGVRCWGETGNSQLPIALGGDSHLAVRGVDAHGFPLAGVEMIAIGHYIGYSRMGTSWLGWGEGHSGALTSATDMIQSATAIPLLDGATSISAGYLYACGLWPPGEVRCWGDDEYGQLAHAPIGTDTGGAPRFDPMPTRVALPADAQAVSAAGESACAIVGADVWCWGIDTHGALGTFAPSSASCGCEVAPVKVDLPADVSLVELASTSTAARVCGRTADGRVFCWGESVLGGAGGIADVSAPELPILGPSGAPLLAAHLAVGPSGACAIDMDGEVWCWGANVSGELATAPDMVAHDTAVHVVFP